MIDGKKIKSENIMLEPPDFDLKLKNIVFNLDKRIYELISMNRSKFKWARFSSKIEFKRQMVRNSMKYQPI